MKYDFVNLDYLNQSFAARIDDLEHAFSSEDAFFNLTKCPYKDGYTAINVEPSRGIYIVIYSDGKQTQTEHSEEVQWMLNNWQNIKEACNIDLANMNYNVWTLQNERDSRLNATDWLVARQTEQKLLGITTSLTDSQFTALLNYRQQLRTITDTYTTLDNVIWPVNPISS